MNSPGVTGSSRTVGLDTVRGLAVVAVVAYHLGFWSGGFLGVDLFFVLSGYLITALALSERARTGAFDLVAFWGRRIRRLAPALLVMVPVVIVVAHLLGWDRTTYGSLRWDAATTLTWTFNWRQALASDAGYWGSAPSLFRHTWSLGIEEQFYLVWPLVLIAAYFLARRLGAGRHMVVAVIAAVGAGVSAIWSVVLAHRLPVEDLTRIYAGTDTRIFGPLVGCVLACIWPLGGRPVGARTRRALAVAGLAAAAVTVWLMVTVDVSDPAMYRWGVLPLTAVLAAVIIPAATLLSRTEPVSVWLGRRSYAIYLWSWPIQVIAQQRWPDLDRWVIAAITVPLTLAIAEISWWTIEHPAQRRTGWAQRPTTRYLFGAAAATTAAIILVAVTSTALPPPAHERFDTASSLDAGKVAPSAVDPSGTGAGSADETVMVVGDSVAFNAAFHSPTGRELPEGVARIDVRAVIGCGLLSAEGYQRPRSEGGWGDPSGGDCVDVDEVIDTGLSGNPDVLVTIPGAWENAPARSPDGEIIDALSPRMAEVLVDRLVDLARRADSVGARTLIIPWACPGPETAPERQDPDYIAWMGQVSETAAATSRGEGLTTHVARVPDTVCVDGDPTGSPTKPKNKAMGNEVHVADADGGRWLWQTWFGPEIVRTRPAGDTS